MKKLLALVLALVMTLGLATVGTSAAFSDADSINYGEAVDVMSAIGVLDGMENGAFNPTGILTREQAAKIITYMILGKSSADALVTIAAPYSDVAADRWSAGAIAYCTNEGILAGTGNGKFDPAGQLTGLAFAKMCLVALGYKADVEGLVGSNWSINAAKLALTAGLTDDMDDVALSAPMTREQAAKMAFNTELATMVKYDNNSTITAGDVTIRTQSAAEDVTANISATANHFGSAAVNNVHTVQFAEKYCSKLTERSESALGRTGRVMQYKGKDVAEFAATDTVLASVSAGNAYAEMTAKGNKKYIGYDADATVTYYYNDGAAVAASGTPTSGGWPGDAASLDDNIAAIKTTAAKDGVIVNFIDTNSNGKYDIVSVLEKTVDVVTGAVRTSTTGALTKVTIPGVLTDVNADDVVYPALAKDDVVLVYTSANGTTYIEKAASFTGKMTADNGTAAYIDGTKYDISGLTGAKTLTNLRDSAKSKADTTFYTDDNGNLIWFVTAKTTADLSNTLYVRDAKSAGYVYSAKVVFMDGKTGTITVDKTAAYNGSLKDVSSVKTTYGTAMTDGMLKVNYFYTYTVNDAGHYELTACQYQDVEGDGDITKGGATLTTDHSGNVYATSTTAYILEKEGSWSRATYTPGTSYTTYTGVANTANYVSSTSGTNTSTNGYYVLLDSSNYAIAVVSFNGKLSTASASDYDAVFVLTDEVAVYKSNGNVDYYMVDAIVDGELVEGYKLTTGLIARGVAGLVNGYDDGKANTLETSTSPVNMVPQTLCDRTNNVVALELNGSTLSAKKADGTVVGAIALADNAVMVVYDYSAKTYTMGAAEEQFAATGKEFTVYTVTSSTTNSAVKYVFVVSKDLA